MWVLIEVDNQFDICKNERRRFLLRRHIALTCETRDNIFVGEYHIDEYMTEVHPATKEVE